MSVGYSGTPLRTLELRHPSWRTPMRYMGIEPDDVLSHAMATGAPGNILPGDTALEFIHRALADDLVEVV